MKLKLQNLSEAFLIELDSVLYFEADDHYTRVVMAEGHKFLIPFGLVHVEIELASFVSQYPGIIRIGRRHIVNMTRVFHINLQKQVVMLNDNRGTIHSLQVSKTVIKNLLESLQR